VATRAQVESILIDRTGGYLALADIAAAPRSDASPRAYLGDPIAWALRGIGLPLADPSSPSDLEVAAVPDGSFDEVLDRAELRVLLNVVGNWTAVTEQAGTDRQEWSKLLDQLWKRVQTLREDYPSSVAGALVGGTIGLDFQATTVEVS
jgi:hypothetical protein